MVSTLIFSANGLCESTGTVGGKDGKKTRITLLNMSSIGLLVQLPEGRVRAGDVIRFCAVSKGQRLTITAKAMRVEEVKDGKENIGYSIQLVNLG